MKNQFNNLLPLLLSSRHLHAKWLNTLAYLENIGSVKIAGYIDPVKVSPDILKHSAEEARHAWFFKQAAEKVAGQSIPDFSSDSILAPIASKRLLNLLDVRISKYLKQTYPGLKVKDAAYLLVTYAIEVRANDIYPTYQSLLSNGDYGFTIKSVLAEEATHLSDMEEMMPAVLPDSQRDIAVAIQLESELFGEWMTAIEKQLVLITAN